MFKQFGKSDTSKPAANVVGMDAASAASRVTSNALRSLATTDKELKDRLDLKSRLHEALLERLNLSVIDKVATDELRREVASLVQTVLAEEKRPMRTEDFKLGRDLAAAYNSDHWPGRMVQRFTKRFQLC